MNLFRPARNLPPPLRPTSARTSDSDDDNRYRQGSLSDYSDYESSDEETHNRASASGSGSRKAYRNDDKDDEVDVSRDTHKGLLNSTAEDDPFADPFVDQDEEPGVGTPGIQERKLVW